MARDVHWIASPELDPGVAKTGMVRAKGNLLYVRVVASRHDASISSSERPRVSGTPT
jgi:hypothetical protein